jgi:hypothetical protein
LNSLNTRTSSTLHELYKLLPIRAEYNFMQMGFNTFDGAMHLVEIANEGYTEPDGIMNASCCVACRIVT